MKKMKVGRGDEGADRRGGRRSSINDDELKAKALATVEQNGIVFLDEIDKIASRQETHGADVSRQGVQRDLLPLVEGTTVATKYGMVQDRSHPVHRSAARSTSSKPSDLIPELQGRFPIRVELASLSVADFEQILTATDACLTRQYQALLATENVDLDFQPDGIRRLAEIAFAVNEKQENIGARRLYTVMERLLDEVSFDAAKLDGQRITIDAAYVDEARLAGIVEGRQPVAVTSSRKLAAGGKAYRVSNLRFRNALVFDGSGRSPVVSDVSWPRRPYTGRRPRSLRVRRRKSSMRTGSR